MRNLRLLSASFVLFVCSVASAATPIVTFTASPTSTRISQAATLTWTSTNAVSCTASGGWSGAKALQGSEVAHPMMTTSYTLTFMGSQGETVVRTVTVTVDSGMGIVKAMKSGEPLLGDNRLDGAVWRVGWKDFQPTSAADEDTTLFEEGVASIADNGKLAILELEFSPTGVGMASDQGTDRTNIPQWAKDEGARFVIDPGVTNEFPVWWDPIYLAQAKNAITKLTDIYNDDDRVAAYVITGASGVLPTSLAGEQTPDLLDNFIAEGFVTTEPGGIDEVDFQLPSQGYNYGLAVRDIMLHWVTHTTKPVIYVTRPIFPGQLAEELESDPVNLYTRIAVINNGFRQCDDQDITQRFINLQAGGHLVGWWGLAVNGFPTDTVAAAIHCASGSLDMKRVWICLDDTAWDEQPGALDASVQVYHPTDFSRPTRPTRLTATPRSESEIDLSWTGSSDNVGVYGYKAYRDGAVVWEIHLTSPGFSDLDLEEARQYGYTITAYDACGNKSLSSATATATTYDITAPSRPMTLTATAVSGSEIDLAWIASTDNVAVTGYNIFRDGVKIGTTAATTFASTGLDDATKYTYNVSAYDAAGNTSTQTASKSATTFDVTAPTKPTGLTAVPVSVQKITLTWVASTDNFEVDAYKIYQNGVEVATSNDTTHDATGLAEATTYTFTVAAFDPAGNVSAQSTAVSATTLDATAPSQPTGLTATVISSSQIDLAWSAASDNVGVTGYKVYRDKVQIGTTTTRTFSSTGLSDGVKYSYTVAAYDAAGNTSKQSASVSATTFDVTAPSIPIGLVGTPTSATRIDLVWLASTDNVRVTGYKIYRNGVEIATKTTTTYADTGLARNTSYTYTVAAYDAAGNVSAQSTAVTVRTLP